MSTLVWLVACACAAPSSRAEAHALSREPARAAATAAAASTAPHAPRAAAQDASAAAALSGAWAPLASQRAGPERARAAAALLADHTQALGSAETELAWRIGVAEADALRFESAEVVQRALYERAPALWSASNLALTLNRLRGAEAADSVLAPLLAHATRREAADLWSQRGTYLTGAGSRDAATRERGRSYLGRAVALGSADAAVVLAREDLEHGRIDAARAGFRAGLVEPEPSPWALRGFGVALLTP